MIWIPIRVMQSISISGLLFGGGGLGGYQSRVNLVSYLKTPTIAHFFCQFLVQPFLDFTVFHSQKHSNSKINLLFPRCHQFVFFGFSPAKKKRLNKMVWFHVQQHKPSKKQDVQHSNSIEVFLSQKNPTMMELPLRIGQRHPPKKRG